MDSFNEAVSVCIKRKRAAGVKIERIAADLDVSSMTVRNWQDMKAEPHQEVRAKVADYFGIRVVVSIIGTDGQLPDPPVS